MAQQVIWCKGNTTLYFTAASESLKEGDEFNGQTVTTAWGSDDILSTTTDIPAWATVVGQEMTQVVIDSSFQDVKLTSTSAWFQGCEKLASIEGLAFLNTQDVTTMSNMFYGCKSLKEINLNGLYTENLVNMANMFHGCTSLTSIDLNSLYTGKVKNMSSLFYGCTELKSVRLDSIDTYFLSDMSYMFSGCTGLDSLDLDSLNTMNVKDMSYMFNECTQLRSIKLSRLKTNSVQNMTHMFCNCRSLVTLDVSRFETSNVGSMSYMFYGCSSLESINVNSFRLRNIYVSISNMFRNCSSLTTIYCNLTWTNQHSGSMFLGCPRLVGGIAYDPNKTDAKYATPDNGYFTPLNKITYTVLWLRDISTLYFTDLDMISIGDYFEGHEVTNVWRGASVTDMDADYPGWYSINSSVRKIIIEEGFNDARPTNTCHWFSRCTGLITGLRYLNTEEVTDMSYMFQASIFTIEDDEGTIRFNTSKVKNMKYMFANSRIEVAELGIKQFDTHNVENMSYMFYGCTYLKELNVSSFNTNKVKNMSYMFYGCSKLKTIYCNDTWECASSTNMFSGCTSLPNYSEQCTDGMYANPAMGYFSRIAVSGISGIQSQATRKASLYDLSGRKINQPLKGKILIQDGKKILYR